MPIHDWTRVSAGIYHNFHQDWTIEICRTLNRGILPEGYYAMADQWVSGLEPGVIALRLRGPGPSGGLAVTEAPPRIPRSAQTTIESARYALKANRIVIREELGRVVAMIEVVSPGNKDSRSALGSFLGKVRDFVRNGIHVLVIDPFPVGPRDPEGLAQPLWNAISMDRYEEVDPLATRPADRPLSVIAIDAGDPLTLYQETLAVGACWPEAPLFLASGWYVNVPLEMTYMTSWDVTPRPIRDLVELRR